MCTVPLTLVAATLLAPQGPSADELQAALQRAVDLPTSAERAVAIPGLLKMTQDVATWRAACARFGTFAPLDPGPSREQVDLRVLDKVESTELHLYVPPGYDPGKPAPLLLWGHGSGGTGAREHTMWQQVADGLGMLVLAPTEPAAIDGYSKAPRERAAALAALRWARRRANVDENAIFVGGWSRGGHLAWDLALRHPDLFAGALPVVGGPMLELGPANNLRYLENVATLPIRDLQGSQDDPLLLANLHLAFARLQKWKAKDARLIEFADRGHDADLGAVDWPAFFAVRRTPRPQRLVRIAAEAGEARAAWLEITRFTKKVQVEAQPQVDERRWQGMNDAQQRAFLLDKLAEHTARLQVTDKKNGRFEADGQGIAAFTLWLQADQLGKDGKVEVRLANKPVKKAAAASAEVLLRDFVERFDRTRLPVARVDVP